MSNVARRTDLPPVDETHALLIQAAACGAKKRAALQDQVIEQHLCLAQALARRYKDRGIAIEDLTQVAALALVKSVQRYDASRGVDFIKFAVPTIRGELHRNFRDAGWTVRPPRRIQEVQGHLSAVEGELTHELARTPGDQELADAMDIPVTDVSEARAARGCFTPTSLDADQSGTQTSLTDRLGYAESGYSSVEARLTLAKGLERLSRRDRRIVDLRFFRGWTQQQIGDDIGVTQMQVSRLLNRILSDLRSVLDDAA